MLTIVAVVVGPSDLAQRTHGWIRGLLEHLSLSVTDVMDESFTSANVDDSLSIVIAACMYAH